MVKIDLQQEEIIEDLLQRQSPEYNNLKAAEEFQELSLVLTQKHLKPKKINEQEIIDEIGDAIIRLNILCKKYDSDLINTRVNEKLTKFAEWSKTKRFEQI